MTEYSDQDLYELFEIVNADNLAPMDAQADAWESMSKLLATEISAIRSHVEGAKAGWEGTAAESFFLEIEHVLEAMEETQEKAFVNGDAWRQVYQLGEEAQADMEEIMAQWETDRDTLQAKHDLQNAVAPFLAVPIPGAVTSTADPMAQAMELLARKNEHDERARGDLSDFNFEMRMAGYKVTNPPTFTPLPDPEAGYDRPPSGWGDNGRPGVAGPAGGGVPGGAMPGGGSPDLQGPGVPPPAVGTPPPAPAPAPPVGGAPPPAVPPPMPPPGAAPPPRAPTPPPRGGTPPPRGGTPPPAQRTPAPPPRGGGAPPMRPEPRPPGRTVPPVIGSRPGTTGMAPGAGMRGGMGGMPPGAGMRGGAGGMAPGAGMRGGAGGMAPGAGMRGGAGGRAGIANAATGGPQVRSVSPSVIGQRPGTAAGAGTGPGVRTSSIANAKSGKSGMDSRGVIGSRASKAAGNTAKSTPIANGGAGVRTPRTKSGGNDPGRAVIRGAKQPTAAAAGAAGQAKKDKESERDAERTAAVDGGEGLFSVGQTVVPGVIRGWTPPPEQEHNPGPTLFGERPGKRKAKEDKKKKDDWDW